MFRLKGCPRCHGDMYLEQDRFGIQLVCLQCGYVRPPRIAAAGRREPVPQPAPVRVADR